MSSTPATTRTWILASFPKGLPTYSAIDDQATFKLVERELPALGKDQVLAKALYLSNDPAQRLSIDPSIPEERRYASSVPLNSPMDAYGLAKIVKSTSDRFTQGMIVGVGQLGWNEYVVLDASQCAPRPPLPKGLELSHYVGAFGGTGVTAYYGLVVVGEAKPSMRVVVSGAAGATGSMVVQIAKKIVGCSEVIGIAGTEAKCRWVESLGADKCINYKSATFEQDLIKATDGFVDLYFDNVGNTILDLMLARLKRHGVVVACGSISAYNDSQPTILKSELLPALSGPRASLEPAASSTANYQVLDYMQIVMMRLSIRGFIVLDYLSKWEETLQLLCEAVQDGRLKVTNEESEQVVETAFEDVPKTWLKLFQGGNTGKLVTKIV